MTIKIDGHYISLMDKDVRAARQMLKHFFDVAEKEAEKQGNYTFKYTLPIVAAMLSNERVKAIGTDVMALILNAAADNESKKAFKLVQKNTEE